MKFYCALLTFTFCSYVCYHFAFFFLAIHHNLIFVAVFVVFSYQIRKKFDKEMHNQKTTICFYLNLNLYQPLRIFVQTKSLNYLFNIARSSFLFSHFAEIIMKIAKGWMTSNANLYHQFDLKMYGCIIHNFVNFDRDVKLSKYGILSGCTGINGKIN